MWEFLLLILLHLNIIIYIQAIKCDENAIEHCIECDSGENSGSCSKCENTVNFISSFLPNVKNLLQLSQYSIFYYINQN